MQLASRRGTTTIAVDGLDEYVPSRGDEKFHAGPIEIFDTLRATLDTCRSSCRMFVTSRPHCLEMYHGLKAEKIKLTASDNDIRLYVVSSLQEDDFSLSPLLRDDTELQARVVDMVVERANGQ